MKCIAYCHLQDVEKYAKDTIKVWSDTIKDAIFGNIVIHCFRIITE